MDISFLFIINFSIGDIVISRFLNREDTDRYRIRVFVYDFGWIVSIDVIIFVIDVNDNVLRFSRFFYYLDCFEFIEIGFKVI